MALADAGPRPRQQGKIEVYQSVPVIFPESIPANRSVQVIRGISRPGHDRIALTIGNFDGVHRGHQALVAQAVADARKSGGTAVVLTFDPHPSRVLAPERAPASLTTLGQ